MAGRLTNQATQIQPGQWPGKIIFSKAVLHPERTGRAVSASHLAETVRADLMVLDGSGESLVGMTLGIEMSAPISPGH